MSAERPSRPGKKGAVAPPSLHVGDERAGFDLSVDRPKRVLRLRMWGLWNVAVAEEFRTAVLKHGRVLEGAPWGILADTRGFVAQPSAVTGIRKDVMQRVLPMGCTRIAALGEDAVHAMQFKRIAGESHVEGKVFHDEESALTWASEHPGDRP